MSDKEKLCRAWAQPATAAQSPEQVYDRVMLGVFIWLAMKFGRSHLMDHVIVGLDNRLSRETFQRLLQVQVDQLPASVCSLTSPIVAMVPATFAPLAVAIGWLARKRVMQRASEGGR